MRTYRTYATISNDGTLTLKKLPFESGDKVEVVVRYLQTGLESNDLYPLRGTPIRYEYPFEGVSESDWDALR